MYGEACSSPIFYTLLEYLAKHLPETHDARTALETMKLTLFDLDHTASHLGKALGLLHFIKHAHHHAARNQCYLPAEILSKYHLSQESMMRPSSQQQEMVASVMHDVASVAAAHLEKVKNELLDKLTLVPRPVLKNNPFALVFLPYVSGLSPCVYWIDKSPCLIFALADRFHRFNTWIDFKRAISIPIIKLRILLLGNYGCFFNWKNQFGQALGPY